MAHSSSGENSVSIALRNELILQEIFSFLPLKSLLTLSQVNKFWNAEARTYIRDHRKCTVSISSSTIPPCAQLEQLDQDLARMAIVPFNSLKITLRLHTEPGSGNNRHRRGQQQNLLGNFNNSGYENLISKLKLKYLSLLSWDEGAVACTVTSLIFRLLTAKATELKSLRFKEISLLLTSLTFVTDQLEFPRLEELDVGDVNEWMEHDDHGEKSVLQSILDGAPKLETIAHDGSPRILKILPESKYKLLTNFQFGPFPVDEELTRRLVDSGPKISQIRVICIIWEPDEENGVDVPAPCSPLFHPLAQACSSTLKKLLISCASAIQKLRMIPHPLSNVTHLTLGFDRRHPLDFVREFQLVPWQYLFPKLQEVNLDVRDAGILEIRLESSDALDGEFRDFVPDPQHSSLTTKKMNLTFEIYPSGLLQLMKMFPNLEHLEITAGSLTSHSLPYRDIFRFWPGLKTLAIHGQVFDDPMLHSCDADFCGMDQEELELLREMDAGDLEKLQIVSARPCVSTMKSTQKARANNVHLIGMFDDMVSFCGNFPDLETLSMSFLLAGYPYPHNRVSDLSSRFLSPVTEILVLKRMPWLNFTLKFRLASIIEDPLITMDFPLGRDGWPRNNHVAN